MVYSYCGCGTEYMGVGAPDSQGACEATLWVTALWMPIAAIRRERVIFGRRGSIHRGASRSLEIVEELPLSSSSISTTYVLHYGVVLPLIIGPLLLIPPEDRDQWGPWWMVWFLVVLVIAVWVRDRNIYRSARQQDQFTVDRPRRGAGS